MLGSISIREGSSMQTERQRNPTTKTHYKILFIFLRPVYVTSLLITYETTTYFWMCNMFEVLGPYIIEP